MNDTAGAFLVLVAVASFAGLVGAGGYARGRVDGVASVCEAIACKPTTRRDDPVPCVCPSPNREPDDTGARDTGEETGR